MTIEEREKITPAPVKDTTIKTKEELLCEVHEKVQGEQRQTDAETCRAAAQLKEEIYQNIDEPSSL